MEQAVGQFQRQNHLLPDGVVGPKSWALLEGGQSTRPSEVEPRWLQLARGEIGVAEIPGGQHNPRIVTYRATTTLRATSDETAWCSSFVNWCLTNTRITGTNSAAASWIGWEITTSARMGAITIIFNAAAARGRLSHSGNHVGSLIEETTSHY